MEIISKRDTTISAQPSLFWLFSPHSRRSPKSEHVAGPAKIVGSSATQKEDETTRWVLDTFVFPSTSEGNKKAKLFSITYRERQLPVDGVQPVYFCERVSDRKQRKQKERGQRTRKKKSEKIQSRLRPLDAHRRSPLSLSLCRSPSPPSHVEARQE